MGADLAMVNARPFVSPGLGLLLWAPSDWDETGDADFFQVCDPVSGAQLTASGFENPGLSADQWAAARFAVVNREMPWLRPDLPPRAFPGAYGDGFAADWRGVFPDGEAETHYRVLCLHRPDKLISFTLAVEAARFEAQADFFEHLLSRGLCLAG